MEPSEQVETDPWVDQYVAVPEGEDQYVEAVAELPEDDGLNGESDNWMPLEAGDGRNGPPPVGAAGVDAYPEQATGNGQVAASSGPQWAPYRDSWKLAPRKPFRIWSILLRFPLNLCL